MQYIIAAATDIGIKKSTNQDALSVRTLETPAGPMVFAVLCDGMGGLAKGEVASATLVRAFDRWMMEELPVLSQVPIADSVIRDQWEKIIATENKRIMDYGRNLGVNLGTTVVAMLLTDTRYYILNIGDSRAYEITEGLRQITVDQTVVNREISLGNLTQEQALKDPRRSVLLQCVGASETVYPELFFGDNRQNAVYMLCSDGFRHEVDEREILDFLSVFHMTDEENMRRQMEQLIELNKVRKETDNISVVTVRTF